MAEQTAPPNSSSHSFLLKEMRESKGLTLDIVHEATKIPMDALKAIEQGYSVRILTPFYYRGFIKIYAEFLGLNSDEVLISYKLDKLLKPPVTVTKAKPRPAKNNYVQEQVQEALTQIWTVKNRQMFLRVLAFIIGAMILFKVGGCMATYFKNKPKTKPAVLKIKEAKPLTVSIVPADDTIKAAASVNHKVELVVRAVKDSWIQVKTDGKTAFQMTMKKGTMESWTAQNQIVLSGKNINELELEVNGKHIGTLGSVERRAKRVVITKDGLSVKK